MSDTAKGLTPSLGEARELAKSYDVVPLYAEFIGDLETPSPPCSKFADEDNVFLLESAEAAEPLRALLMSSASTLRGHFLTRTVSTPWWTRTGVREVPAKDPFRGLAEILGEKSVAPLPNLPAFVGGAVGYFSYDAVRYLERLPGCSAR